MEFTLQLAVVGAVLGLAGTAAWFLRRTQTGWGFRAIAKELAVRERLQLTPQHSLHLVRFRERDVLLIAHPNGCTVIEEEK